MMLEDKLKQLFDVKANNETLNTKVNKLVKNVDDTYNKVYEYVEDC